MKKNLVIKHDLSQLTDAERAQYLSDVSEYVGIDPGLNAFDTIFMDNESGPGRSLVVYARRGTAEILRNLKGINVSSLTNQITPESAVFTATGTNRDGRQEIAVGSKSLRNLAGKAYDNAIMTASTRALRRLTMQFTELGILDESEIEGVHGSTVNPAASAELAGSPVVIPPAPAVVNNAPGRDVTQPLPVPQMAILPNFAENQKEMIQAAMQQVADKEAARTSASQPALAAATTVDASVTASAASAPETDTKADKPKRAPRKSKNTVSMSDVEPEVVNNAPATPPEPEIFRARVTAEQVPENAPVKAQYSGPAAPTPAPATATATVVAPPAVPAPNPGLPSAEQMTEYRKKVSVYTAELPGSANMGSVQKMRAFITKQTGTIPQEMTTDQWEEMLGWFDSYVAANKVAGLVKHINESLGVN